MKKQKSGRREIFPFIYPMMGYLLLYFLHLLHMFYYGPDHYLLPPFRSDTENCERDIFVIKLVTLLSCSSCIGCWLMEDTIMAPILNFYGTSPGMVDEEGRKEQRQRS